MEKNKTLRRGNMKKILAVMFLMTAALAFGQQKYALVIGNGAYTTITKLNNPVNDANDMAAALEELGFTVDKVVDGSLEQMENAVLQLKKRLSSSRNTYGFLFYAGHGVQSGGENYLIPVNANIQTENSLRRQSIAVQEMLDELNDARNELNVVVLDACRDNPFPWKRSGSRGLQVVGNQPSDSIIVFATSAGSTAADGTGKNGLFTSHLLNNIKNPGLEVSEVFRMTMGDVARASGNQQRPAIYNQFSGLAYLGTRPDGVSEPVSPVQVAAVSPSQPTPSPMPSVSKSASAGTGPIGYSLMNIAFGFGSYKQGDTVGGVIVTSGLAATAALILVEAFGVKRGDDISTIPGNIGIGLGIGTLAFGFVKPFLFKGNQHVASAIDNFNIVLVSSEQSRRAVAFRYTYNF
jgi:antitoxin component of RelBE/YafQ-DinJ toxin-antitoxin module